MSATPKREALRPGFWLLVCACILLIRDLPLLLHPAFWAEDGAIFYAAAFNHASWTLPATPYQGYLHIIPRLASLAATLLPVEWAPSFFSVTAAIFMILPLFYILSSRSDPFLPGTRRKASAAVAYAIAPYGAEAFGNLTNVQWFSAILILLIVQCNPAPTRRLLLLDYTLLTLAALTGPLAPLALAACLWPSLVKRRDVRMKLAVLLAAACVQASLIALSPRMHGHFSAAVVSSMLSTHVVAVSFLGWNSLLTSANFWQIAGPIVWVGCFALAVKERDSFTAGLFVFSTLILAVASIALNHGPGAYYRLSYWTDTRYYAIPILTLMVSWFSRFAEKPSSAFDYARIAAAACAVALAVPGSLVATPHERGGTWQAQVRTRYYPAPIGKKVALVQAPTGWHVWLIRR